MQLRSKTALQACVIPAMPPAERLWALEEAEAAVSGHGGRVVGNEVSSLLYILKLVGSCPHRPGLPGKKMALWSLQTIWHVWVSVQARRRCRGEGEIRGSKEGRKKMY